MKKYYGFRFFSGRNCTMGEPNATTGRCSIAGDAMVFATKEDLERWIAAEKRTSPCGLGGGKRVACTKKQLRRLCAGDTQQEFDDFVNGQEDY